jgi:hypothetical protein
MTAPWSGTWDGDWLGTWEGSAERPPGFISGTAIVRFTGRGRLTNATQPAPQPSGRGYGFLPERPRRRDTDDDLLVAVLLV